MQNDKNTFRHESMQDSDNIRDILQAIVDGFDKGKLHFSDEDGDLEMSPEGLLHMKLTASKEDSRNRFNLRVTWQDDIDTNNKQKNLSINGRAQKKTKSKKSD